MQEPQSSHRAPPGAACAEHSERPAAFTCPRCGNYACIFCWHPIAERCDTCLKRDPAAAAPALPWETQQGSALSRFFRTLGGSFRPLQTAPAFARPGGKRAIRFFLLSALPLAALAGIIPRTKTLLFGNFTVVVQGHPSSGEIALDILAAMGMQLGASVVEFASVALPYVSLTRAYAPAERHGAAMRVLLYRVWLSPFATQIINVAAWLLPTNGGSEVYQHYVMPFALANMLLHLLLLSSLRATVRLACGVGPLLSYVIVIVTVIVWALVQQFWGLLPSL
jgi:hypothetical protein